jgi:hypothetical protein
VTAPGGKARSNEPELLAVPLIALHLDDGQPVPPLPALGPGAQQGGLATARRGRDQRYLRFGRAIERCEQFPALNQTRRHQARLPRFCLQCHA